MAKVDIDLIEKKASEKDAADQSVKIQEKELGGKKYFRHPSSEDWFDDFGECLKNAESIARTKRLKALGLNEHGQSASAIALNKKKGELLAQKAKLLEQIKAFDVEIGKLRLSDFIEEKTEKKTEKKAK